MKLVTVLVLTLLTLAGVACTRTPRPAATAADISAHNTTSYGWPATGVYQDTPTSCLGASSVTFLETFGIHISQQAYGTRLYKPGWSVLSDSALLNTYLRADRKGVTVVNVEYAMTVPALRQLLASALRTGPVLITILVQDMPYDTDPAGWHGAHETMIYHLSGNTASVWDPWSGFETVPLHAISDAAYEYLVPVPQSQETR